MNTRERNLRKLNGSITKRVIELHANGYEYDFLMLGSHLLCLQNNQRFPVGAVDIKVVDQGYDKLSRSFKYVHVIETCSGEKGLMIVEAIFTNSSFPKRQLPRVSTRHTTIPIFRNHTTAFL